MDVFPASLVVMALWVWVSRRAVLNAVYLIAALLPFGMFALINLGGFSFLAADFVAFCTIGLALFALILVPPETFRIPRAGIPLLLYGAYSAFASTILVRVFSGEVQVFAFNRLFDGERVSVHFSGSKMPLAPSSANISQLIYIFLAIGLFFLFVTWARSKGTQALVFAMILAGGVNATLACLDFLALDGLLAFIRTADYAVLNNLSVAGIPRVIGGFSEAAPFGAFSVALGGFLLVYGALAAHSRAAWIGLANVVAAAFSLSSTAFIGLFVFGLCASVFLGPLIFTKIAAPRLMAIFLGISLALAAVAVVLIIQVNAERFVIADILDRLLFSKLDSVSGQERGAMAWNGLEVFAVTWGLGAGAGSVVSSGYFTAVLGSVGIPGALLLAWFYWAAFFAPSDTSTEALAINRACQCFFFVSLATAATSAVAPNPGNLTCIIAAIAVSNALSSEKAGLGKAIAA